MSQIHISLEKNCDDSYDILFSENYISEIQSFIKSNSYSHILILSESNISQIYLEYLETSLQSDSYFLTHHIFPAGESSKNIHTVLEILQTMIERNFSRKSLVIWLWGWVVWDMTGFVSAIYMRGVDYIWIPTSLLSMVDSSLGGKTGVNFWDTKNILWSFKQAKKVIIDLHFLETLPEIQIQNGFFEMLKHSIIDSKEHYENLIQHDSLFSKQYILWDVWNLEKILLKNIQVKADIVEKDEFETYERKFLNYGHTFWHAIEALSHYALPHGFCVGFGIVFVNILWVQLWISNKESIQAINIFLKKKLSAYSPETYPLDNLIEKMKSDKKNETQAIQFVILKDFGTCVLQEVSSREFLENVYEEFKRFLKI